MAAPVVWFEIAGRDLDTLTRFYGDLLGWKVDADNPQRYGMVDTGAEGGIPGGIYAPGDPVGEYVSFYAAVQGLEGYLERAERLGGKVVQQPTPISETARVAMFLDPRGTASGCWSSPERRELRAGPRRPRGSPQAYRWAAGSGSGHDRRMP